MNYLAQWFDFDYWAELGEILTNLLAAVMRGEISESDAREYLKAIGQLPAKQH